MRPRAATVHSRRAAPPGALVRGSKLVDRSSASCGCQRADPGVRQTTR
jgi:hypothetical protein